MPRAVRPAIATASQEDRSCEQLNLKQAFGKYADYVVENYPQGKCFEIINSLKLFTSYLAADDLDEKPFCDHGIPGIAEQPVGLLDKLDNFFRYHLLREMITSPVQRKSIRANIFDLFKWAETEQVLSPEKIAGVKSIAKRLNSLDQSAIEAQKLLIASLRKKKPKGGYIEIIEFGRHDLAKIDGSNIWLEIWSLMILPDETEIGPIAVPPAVASRLEPGWMIASELGKRRDGQWEFIEVTAIHPSLPFK